MRYLSGKHIWLFAALAVLFSASIADATRGVNLSVDSTAKTTNIGVNATYMINLTNNGTDLDSYTLTIDNPNAASTAALSIQSYIALNAGQSAIFFLNVTNISTGIFYVNVTARSNNDSSKFGHINTTTSVTAGSVTVLWSKLVGSQLIDVKVGDINRDGLDDVVVGPSENKIEAIKSSGALLWDYSTNYWVWHVAIGDVNGDSYNDVVGYDAQNPGYLYAINSSGTLLWQYQLPITGSGNDIAEHIAIGDINNDGKNEVIVGADAMSAIYVFNQTGGVIWTYSTPSFIPNVKVGDIDGNGIKDVIVSSGYDGPGWLIVINGSGTRMWNYSFGERVGESVFGDINDDGENDIVVLDWSGDGSRNNIYAVNNSGDALIWSYSLDSNANTIALGDIDGDGKNEVVVGAANNNVYAINRNGGLIWNYSIGGSPGISKVAIDDLDGNGLNDIAVSSYSGSVLALNGYGNLVWKFTGSSYFRDLEIGDTNGDGIKDVVAISDDKKVYTLTATAVSAPSPTNSIGYSALVATGQNTYVQSSNGTFGLLLKGQTKTITGSVVLNNTGDVSAKVEARFNDSIGGMYGLVSGANVLNATNFALGLSGALMSLSSFGADVQIAVAPQGVTALDARLGVPNEQAAGDYSGTVVLTFSNNV